MTRSAVSASIGGVIRNVVIHLANEQPLVADLFAMPASTDAGLVCTNLRMTDGKRPVFIDDGAATFFFPYLVVRFLEIPPGALARHADEGGAAPAPVAAPVAGADLVPVTALAAGVPAVPDDAPDGELDIDEDFLRRVRDI